MKMLRTVAVLAALLAAVPAFAQQVQNHAVPIGRGGGATGFGAAVPNTAGQALVSTGPITDPIFNTITNSALTTGPINTVKGSLDGINVTDVFMAQCSAPNQAIRWVSGVGTVCQTVSVTTGFDTPINLGLSASASAGALTIGVNQANGSAPSSSNPVLVPFRSLMAQPGIVTYDSITSPLSLVIPSGATLGTSNGVPFRIWIFLDNNGGTPAIGVATCSNSTTVFPCTSWEYALKTTTTINSGSTSGGTLYAAVGVSLDAVRIVGFCDFSSGLATAGVWASSCVTLQVFGPGIKKPGDIVQTVRNSSGTLQTGSTVMPQDNTVPQNTEGDQYFSQSIAPSASANILRVKTQLMTACSVANIITSALFRDSGSSALTASSSGGPVGIPSPNIIDYSVIANAASTTTFAVRAGAASCTVTLNGTGGSQLYGGVYNSFMEIQEIMG